MEQKQTKQNQKTAYILLVLTGIFNISDYFGTQFLLQNGFYEANPIIATIVDTPYFPIVKLLVIPLTLYFIWKVRNFVGHRIVIYSWVVFAAYLSLMVYMVNLLVLLPFLSNLS